MTVQLERLTVEEFEAFTEQPENADHIFEYIGGEIIEVPSNAYVSKVGGIIFGELYIFNKAAHLGHLTGENGGYIVSGERYAPDVAFISFARQPELARKGYNPNPPDLAVEVDFPSSAESRRSLGFKIANYLAAGTLVWVVYPEHKEIEVYTPRQPVKIVGVDGILEGGSVLPGFTLAVKDIFPE